MCRKAACDSCGKPTWMGCGRHIDQALLGVDESARCADWKLGQGKCTSKTQEKNREDNDSDGGGSV